jgi:hypothetical protein
MKHLLAALIVAVLLASTGCSSSVQPPPEAILVPSVQPSVTHTPEPTLTPTPAPSLTPTLRMPTFTPPAIDRSIWKNLISYTEEYGSLTALFESYQHKGFCEYPFKQGYPRLENGDWLFYNPHESEGNIIIHRISQDVDQNEEIFSIDISRSKSVHGETHHIYIFTAPIGAIMLISINGDPTDCILDDNTFAREFLYSPTTNDFVYFEPDMYYPIFRYPIVLISWNELYELYEDPEFTGMEICKDLSDPNEDYLSYILPNSDGSVYTWGQKSGCMTITIEDTQPTSDEEE